ncbi:MAG: hypothetical protein ACREJC_18835 [Tepidisphaeraceae bacterium]
MLLTNDYNRAEAPDYQGPVDEVLLNCAVHNMIRKRDRLKRDVEQLNGQIDALIAAKSRNLQVTAIDILRRHPVVA